MSRYLVRADRGRKLHIVRSWTSSPRGVDYSAFTWCGRTVSMFGELVGGTGLCHVCEKAAPAGDRERAEADLVFRRLGGE